MGRNPNWRRLSEVQLDFHELGKCTGKKNIGIWAWACKGEIYVNFIYCCKERVRIANYSTSQDKTY